jgi:hypothetical protein
VNGGTDEFAYEALAENSGTTDFTGSSQVACSGITNLACKKHFQDRRDLFFGVHQSDLSNSDGFPRAVME